jgi:hypothetical protein
MSVVVECCIRECDQCNLSCVQVKNNLPERERVLLANISPVTAHGVARHGAAAIKYYQQNSVHDELISISTRRKQRDVRRCA